jgi:hypothetical protein
MNANLQNLSTEIIRIFEEEKRERESEKTKKKKSTSFSNPHKQTN